MKQSLKELKNYSNTFMSKEAKRMREEFFKKTSEMVEINNRNSVFIVEFP